MNYIDLSSFIDLSQDRNMNKIYCLLKKREKKRKQMHSGNYFLYIF